MAVRRAAKAADTNIDPPALLPPAGNCRLVSVRYRLTSLVIACVLPVWIAAGFLVYYNYENKRALTEQRMLETARALSLVVDRELANVEGGLTVLATSVSLATGDLASFHRRAQIVLQSHLAKVREGPRAPATGSGRPSVKVESPWD